MSGEAMTQGEMDALRAVMAEATPGPWQADFGGYHFSSLANGYEDIGECIEERNGHALVAAMNSVPRLLDEVERLTVICEEAGMQVGLLEREVERLKRGIEAYRSAHGCDDLDSEWPAVEGCASCAWERSEGKAMEVSGDER